MSTESDDKLIPRIPRSAFRGMQMEMPSVLERRLKDLEERALKNKEEAHRYMIRYWLLKTPVILGAIAAPLITYFSTSDGWAFVGIILGGLTSACAVIDGFYPSGVLRNTYHRAYLELQELQHEVEMRWGPYWDDESEEKLIQELLDMIPKKMKEIEKYVKEAEISLKA